MLTATEQQLHLLETRCGKLEATITGQIEDVKRLTSERSDVAQELADARARVAALEDRLADLDGACAETTLALRASASEFSRTQLLAKRYRNTVNDLQGFCKAYVILSPLAGVSSPDACTIDIEAEGSFTFDGVYGPEDQAQDRCGVHAAVKDVLGGLNTALIGFGPAKVGKSRALLGPDGVCPAFMDTLFDSMHEHEVTHFNARISLGELFMDNFIDHLAEFGQTLSLGGSSDIRSLPVQSAPDVLRYMELAMQRVHTARRPRGHIFVALTVENFNKQGHFRKGSALFVDLASSQPQSAPSGRTAENLWLLRSVTSFCEAVTAAAAGSSDPPGSSLLRLLREAIGGNCKSTLVAVIGGPANLAENVSALTYASHFKGIRNSPTPYDIPAELQRLNLEASLE
jgi:BMFP domain-containing protein YqiC